MATVMLILAVICGVVSMSITIHNRFRSDAEAWRKGFRAGNEGRYTEPGPVIYIRPGWSGNSHQRRVMRRAYERVYGN